MLMKRNIEKMLFNWKNDPLKKPLLIKGSRQVGKTFIMKQFGNLHYKRILYLNFEETQSYKTIFAGDLTYTHILTQIEMLFDLKLTNEILLIFDEIQECPRAITSLKYINEANSFRNIICAGSALGIYIRKNKTSFPVGNIDIIDMYPMTFEEFMNGINKTNLLTHLDNCVQNFLPLETSLHNKILVYYNHYLIVGGYPESVNEYAKSENISDKIKTIYQNIRFSHEADMLKYASGSEAIKVKEVFSSIPSQLAKENKKFQYTKVKKGKTKRDYETAIEWLKSTHMINKCNLIESDQRPLLASANFDMFKLYYNDVGLFVNTVNVSYKDILFNSVDFQYKGVIAENYIANQLTNLYTNLFYWRKNQAELDFVIEYDNTIAPVEVKSKTHTKSKSLNSYQQRYSPKVSIRYSSKNFGYKPGLLSIPLYAVHKTNDYLNIALKKAETKTP